jgi:hypothetical protein
MFKFVEAGTDVGTASLVLVDRRDVASGALSIVGIWTLGSAA